MAYTNPKNIAVKRALAQQLRGDVTPLQGNAHWAQALANIISPAIGGMVERKANEAEQANTDLRSKELQRLMNPPERMTPELAAALGGGSGDPSQAADAWNEEQANWTPSHPDVLAAQLGQKQRLEQIAAQNQRFGPGGMGTANMRDWDTYQQILQTQGEDAAQEFYDMVVRPQFVNLGDSRQRVTGGPTTGERLDVNLAPNQEIGYLEDVENVEAGVANTRDDYDNVYAEYDQSREDASAALSRIGSLERILELSATNPEGALVDFEEGVRNFLLYVGVPQEELTDMTLMNQAVQSLNLDTIREEGARGLTEPELRTIKEVFPRAASDAAAREEIARTLISSEQKTIQDFQDRVQFMESNFEDRNFYVPERLRSYSSPAKDVSDDGFQEITLPDGSKVRIKKN